MLRRWAVVARDDLGLYDIDSWHLTERGAGKRRDYKRNTHASRDTVLLVVPRKRALQMAGALR